MFVPWLRLVGPGTAHCVRGGSSGAAPAAGLVSRRGGLRCSPAWRSRGAGHLTGGFTSASTPENRRQPAASLHRGVAGKSSFLKLWGHAQAGCSRILSCGGGHQREDYFMPDPVSRLQLAQVEIDKVLGDGYARANPQVVSAVMIAASLDWAAMTIAAALVAEEETMPHNGSGLVRAQGLVQP
jgi:hypothetical protein